MAPLARDQPAVADPRDKLCRHGVVAASAEVAEHRHDSHPALLRRDPLIFPQHPTVDVRAERGPFRGEGRNLAVQAVPRGLELRQMRGELRLERAGRAPGPIDLPGERLDLFD